MLRYGNLDQLGKSSAKTGLSTAVTGPQRSVGSLSQVLKIVPILTAKGTAVRKNSFGEFNRSLPLGRASAR